MSEIKIDLTLKKFLFVNRNPVNGMLHAVCLQWIVKCTRINPDAPRKANPQNFGHSEGNRVKSIPLALASMYMFQTQN